MFKLLALLFAAVSASVNNSVVEYYRYKPVMCNTFQVGEGINCKLINVHCSRVLNTTSYYLSKNICNYSNEPVLNEFYTCCPYQSLEP